MFRKQFLIFAVLLFGTLLPMTSSAGEEESWVKKYNFKPVLKAYLQHSWEMTSGNQQRRRNVVQGDNAFDLRRFYFGFTADLEKHVGVQFVGDINAKAASGQQDSDYDLFMKTGFVEFKNFDFAPGLKFVFGQHDLPWVPHIEKIWGYRVQGEVLTDWERYFTSTDVGASVKYEFPEKWGDAHLIFVNGTGYNGGPETDNYKDIHSRVTLRPLSNKNYFVSALGVIGFQGTKRNERYRFGGVIGYKDDTHGTFAGEYVFASDPVTAALRTNHPSIPANLGRNAQAHLLSGFGELKFFWWEDPWSRFSIIGRLDFADPEKRVRNNFHTHGIYGVVYTLNKNCKFLVNHDFSRYANGAGGERGTNTLFAQMEANF